MTSRIRHLPFVIACALLLGWASPSSAQDKTIDYGGDKPGEIALDEHLDEFIEAGILVINEKGDTVDLASLIDKPTILNLVYYRCPGICSPIMNSLAEVVSKIDLEIGKDYQVLTVSFDHTEGTELAVKKKKNYLDLVKKPINPEGWRFFTSDSLDIQKITKRVGFFFKEVGNDYIHPGTLIVLSPKAKITRYLYGTYFLPFEVKLALVEASKGMSGPTINKVLQFCYTYDPEGREYTLNVTKISGSIILFFGLVLLLFLILKPKRKQVNNPKES